VEKKALAGKTAAEKAPLLEVENKKSVQEVAQEETKEEAEEEAAEENPILKFKTNLSKAIGLMIFGTAIVAIFSDPMVDVISDFALKIKINPFYVSFLITPFCSNASELISSLIFAAKKETRKYIPHIFPVVRGCNHEQQPLFGNILCIGIL